jgi:hypothetical protein
MSRSAGKRCAKVPHSRAVPQALGWPVSENGLLPGSDLAHQQVHVVDHVVDPGAPRVLVEAHGPVRGDLGLRVGVELGQRFQLVLRYARELRRVVERIGRNKGLELVEADRRAGRRVALGLAVGAGIAVVARRQLERMVGAQAVADVGDALVEVDVPGDEVLIHRAGLDDVVADVVQDRQVGLRLEDQFGVGHLARAMREGRQHVHLHVLGSQAPVGDARPQDRVHLGHVRAP